MDELTQSLRDAWQAVDAVMHAASDCRAIKREASNTFTIAAKGMRDRLGELIALAHALEADGPVELEHLRFKADTSDF